MIPEFPESQLPAAGSAWIGSTDHGAGIYLLDGRTHLVGHRTHLEKRLLERGAMHIASVRFDDELEERYRPTRSVRRLESRAAIRRFAAERIGRFAKWRGSS
jgi:hypothetical protein